MRRHYGSLAELSCQVLSDAGKGCEGIVFRMRWSHYAFAFADASLPASLVRG